MADLRKQVASALTSSDQSDRALVETSLDRVRALAFADQLGAAVWRLRYANQADAYHKVVGLLARRMRRKGEPLAPVLKLCETVVLEFLDGLCKACGGRGVRADESGVRHTCPTCNGTGVGMMSELLRKRKLNLSDHAYRRWEPRFKHAHEILNDADIRAGFDVASQLGRMGFSVHPKKALALLDRMSMLASGESAHNDNSMPTPLAHSTASAQP